MKFVRLFFNLLWASCRYPHTVTKFDRTGRVIKW